MAVIEVRSPSGPVQALVDDIDYADLVGLAWNLSGGKGSKGKYAAVHLTLNGKQTTAYMHRLIGERMGLILGFAGREGGRWQHSIDHINGDKLDNRRANLRIRTRPEQMRNPNDALRSTNRSGFRGVSFVKMRERFGKPWMAYVTVNYKTINLGWYATAEEAAAARRQWDREGRST